MNFAQLAEMYTTMNKEKLAVEIDKVFLECNIKCKDIEISQLKREIARLEGCLEPEAKRQKLSTETTELKEHVAKLSTENNDLKERVVQLTNDKIELEQDIARISADKSKLKQDATKLTKRR